MNDHIVLDLSTPFTVRTTGHLHRRIKGGLRALERVGQERVELLDRVHAAIESGPIPPDLLGSIQP